MKKSFLHIMALSFLLSVACSPSVPSEYSVKDAIPVIYPDYTDVTVPCNIAPLTFRVNDSAGEHVTRFTSGESVVVVGGSDVSVSIEDWRELMNSASGNSVKVEIFSCEDGEWSAYKPFNFNVSADSIDRYISYRLIPPSYVAYENLSISQRDLTCYDEEVIYSNRLISAEPVGQCINCHAYKNYRTDNMQFHVRQHLGGTVFVHNGNVKKVDMKTDSTISAGVYPSFNPKYDIVAYSVNNTGQIFHTRSSNKVEVQDKASDVIVYNPAKEVVTHVADSPEHLEVFPCWSPDGRTLYYCSAHFEHTDTSRTIEAEMIIRYKEVKYDVLRRPWNPETGEFGPVDTVFVASALGKRATFPRISPDGRYMLFALAEYGCFHIWHKDADLYVMDLETKDMWALDKANSPFPESYHVWSSSGRWILFASRRDDTNYSRLYIAHMNEDGTSDKAFLLPQSTPAFYDFFDRSYNVPEFMVEKVSVSPQEFAEVVKGDAIKVKYLQNVK